MENKNQHTFVFVAIFAIFCAVSVIYMNYTVKDEGKISDAPLVQVYVRGEVKNPGVYKLDVADRVHDAIEKAGGVLESGNASALDLARFLVDGETIYVPPTAAIENAAETQSDYFGAKININTATKEELMTLNGIGDSIAGRIIKYREQHGPFGDVGDLLNVSGIGQKKLEKIKDRVCTD